jgi:hypothetical protein
VFAVAVLLAWQREFSSLLSSILGIHDVVRMLMTAQGQPIEGQLNYFGKLADQKDECNILPSRSIYSRRRRG